VTQEHNHKHCENYKFISQSEQLRQKDMNSHLFLASNDEQNRQHPVVFNDTKKIGQRGAKGSGSSVVKDNYLRSSALTKAQQGEYAEAIALLSQLINRYPHNAIDYNNRGLIYFQSGETEKAFCDYSKALQLNPNLASAYNNRANYYAACGELVTALADYDRALDLKPNYVRAWINRGITLRDLGKYEEASESFEVALVFGQLEGHILAERGRNYHLWGDWNCAIADYHRALALLPTFSAHKEDTGRRLRSQVENWLDELLCPKYC
jgi:tetratricopeptide (TPR) repeat protein